MANAGGFFIVEDTLLPLYNPAGEMKDLEDECEHWAREIEAYAQQNAPWSDRTGDARYQLNAEVDREGDEVIITLAHGVDYGYWLETIQSGEFAIIMPTLEQFAPAVFASVGAVTVGEDLM